MRRGRGLCVLVISAGALVCGLDRRSDAGLEIVSQGVHIDAPDQQVDFTLNFNEVPDFQTADSFGRPADSFQYEIIPNTTQNFNSFDFPFSITAVIRGDEIGSGHVVPIRNGIQNGSDPNPAGGGWGTVRGTTPFTLNGSQLTFAASFDLLGTTNGLISYDLITTNYGSTVSEIQGVSVPLPRALPIGLGLLGGIGMIGLLRKRTRR